MLDKTEGIVLKLLDTPKPALLFTIFTKKHGILSFIVKACEAVKKQAKGNILQPLNLLQLEIYLKRTTQFKPH